MPHYLPQWSDEHHGNGIPDLAHHQVVASAHVLSGPVKLRYPGGKDGMYVVICSCTYQTRPYVDASQALKVAQRHKADKEFMAPAQSAKAN